MCTEIFRIQGREKIMAKDFVLEIGTEELPVEYIPAGMEQLRSLAENELKKERIRFQKTETCSTPCRLILFIYGVDEKQIAEKKEIRGPAEQTAFDAQGKPTAQAIGFAKSQGVKISDLVIKKCDDKNYTFAVHKTKTESTEKILKKILPSLIRAIAFPKMMNWNDSGVSFARPIRWLLALWDTEVIKFEFAGLKSSRFSFGHRYLFPKSFKVQKAGNFENELKKRCCLIRQEERMNIITAQSDSLVKKSGGEVYADKKTLEEVSNLVEYPLCLTGEFSPAYLKIPREILIDVMKVQERCLPVKNKKGELLPLFIIVANRKEDIGKTIKKGYERVMEARFKDARFFYQEDLKKPLSERVDGLKEIILQQELGTLYDKVNRLKELADFFTDTSGLSDEERDDYQLAAALCKTDLLTEVVGEFPDLQGVMGEHYAGVGGVKRAVGKAIFEHYLPRFPGDVLPETRVGALVSIADRIDTLVGYFYLGLIPSGSEDPYSLRRQSNGLLEVILKFGFPFNLEELINHSVQRYQFGNVNEIKDKVINFLKQRLSYILGQKGYAQDFIESVLALNVFIIPDMVKRLEVLKEFRRDKDFQGFLKAFQRVNNILKNVSKDKLRPEINQELVREEAEKELYQTYLEIREEKLPAGLNISALKSLSRLVNPINVFLDKVLVMAPEEDLRFNRLSLLNAIRNLFLNFADFSKIVE